MAVESLGLALVSHLHDSAGGELEADKCGAGRLHHPTDTANGEGDLLDVQQQIMKGAGGIEIRAIGHIPQGGIGAISSDDFLPQRADGLNVRAPTLDAKSLSEGDDLFPVGPCVEHHLDRAAGPETAHQVFKASFRVLHVVQNPDALDKVIIFAKLA